MAFNFFPKRLSSKPSEGNRRYRDFIFIGNLSLSKGPSAGHLFFLPFWLIEWQLDHLRRRVLTMVFHRDFHSHLGPNFMIWFLQMSECDVFFQQRRPC